MSKNFESTNEVPTWWIDGNSGSTSNFVKLGWKQDTECKMGTGTYLFRLGTAKNVIRIRYEWDFEIDKIDIAVAAATIIDAVEETVMTYCNSKAMTRVISSNMLEVFTVTYDFKTLDIVQWLADITTEISREELWLKTHVESIVLGTVEFEKNNLQELVNTVVLSSTIQCIIDSLVKTACNRHATKATNDFAEIINEENNKEESNNAKEEDLDGSKIKKLLSEKAKQQADEEKEEKIDKTEFAEKKTQQK